MKRFNHQWLALGVALTCALPARAETVDKSQYHLFNPVPAESLRDLNTDRPDKTESPITLDAGHFQTELDLITFERDHDTAGGANVLTEAWAFLPVNVKVGLLHNVDLQLVLETFNYVHTDDRVARTTTSQRGFGDITARLKVNLWGNDGGRTACGVMPFVKFPSNQDHLGNHAVEGGVILPLSVDLGAGFDLTAMTEFDFNQNSANDNYHAEFVNSITVGHDLFEKLGAYIEFWSVTSTETGADWEGTFDVGLTYGLTANVQIDTGVNLGITKSAPDLQPFVGLSIRF